MARSTTRAEPGVVSADHQRLSNQMFLAASPWGSSMTKGAPGISRSRYTVPGMYGHRSVSAGADLVLLPQAGDPAAIAATTTTALLMLILPLPSSRFRDGR